MLIDNAVFDDFVAEMADVIVEADGDEDLIVSKGQKLLAQLVSRDDWLPDEFAQPHPEHLKQYILYTKPEQRFSVIGVVWGPGQSAIPHDHTVWGLIGQLRGAERTRNYEEPGPDGALRSSSETVLRPGQTTAVSPTIGDIHDVANVSDGVSISIHVYGGDLSSLAPQRRRFDAETGAVIPFNVSYY